MKKLSVLLACVLLLALLPGCSGNTDSTPAAPSSPAEASAESADSLSPGGYTPQGEEKLHITIESADVTMDELKENDYQVILTVNLDKNPGITVSQWGLQFEKSCTIAASNMYMIVNTVHAINDDTHFLWTAWAGTEVADTGGLLRVGVTLPMDAAPGNTYTVNYADTSAVGGAHQWKRGKENFVEEDAVGWTNGVITVVE